MHRVERQNCIYSETQNCPYSYSEQTCPLLDIWDDFRAGDEVIAITHHATCDKEELSVVRGEILTFIVQHGDKFCKVKNLEGMIGFLPLSHINLKEDFQDEPWYLEVCTRKMAEAIVNPQTRGSYLVWRSDELSDKLIIAVKSQTCVEHFEFRKKGRQLILGDRVYKSIHHVINEFKRKEILVSAIYVTFPNINPNTHFQIIAENLVVTGMNLRASKNFRLHKKISHVAKLREGHTYILIGTLPDRSWYAVRDVVMGVEGYVPAEYLQPLYPPWFHGERSGNEISAALSMCQRTCSFLVAKICAVQNKQTPYVIGVLDPQRKIQIFEIEYKSERVSCFNSVGESIVQLINRFLSENTVPMLRFAITNTGNYPLPTEMTDLDMKTMDLYFTALEEGSEKSYDIRLMIVGHFGVGKTTVARKLLQEPTENIYSTKGIETQK